MNDTRPALLAHGTARAIATLALLVSAPMPAQPTGGLSASAPLPYKAEDTSVGVVNCSSSLCHGAVQRFKDSDSGVLQTEYVIWSRVDKHARAFQTLANEQSKRIASNLGIADPAVSNVCLDCHAHNVPTTRRGERFRLEDGVSCEACHGPAGRWLASHHEVGSTHAGNLANGLYDSVDPVARARLCLSCHFGNPDRFVTHRMMAAGHPRMSFELDTFTAIEPAHFKMDGVLEKRARMWNGAQVWAIGQAIAVSELMKALADPRRRQDGLFPELVLFDCHACHHPMSDKRWVPGTRTVGPGVVRLNDSSMLMAGQIARVVDPSFGARVAEAMTRLQQAVAGGGGDAALLATRLNSEMDELVARLATRTFAEPEMRAILAGLIDDGINGHYRDYADAEQATMAIGSVAAFVFRRGALPSASDINSSLAALNAALSDDEQYSPAQFRVELQNFRRVAGL
jgi:hypothetical protein